MVSAVISRVAIVVFGTLYPAYRSYKAVASKDVKEYVKWMMYWISFAVFSSFEILADIFVSFWCPFYYELKILLIIWLLSPYTRGASYLYRKTIHPTLQRHEKDIDAYLDKFKRSSYTTMVTLGHRGMNYARDAVAQVAIKSQAQLVHQIRKAQSMSDIADNEDALMTRSAGPEIIEVDDDEAELLANAPMRPQPRSRLLPEGYQPPVIEEEYSDDEEAPAASGDDSQGPRGRSGQRGYSEMQDEDFDLADYGAQPDQAELESMARRTRSKTKKGSAGMTAEEKEAYAYGTLPRPNRTMRRPPLHKE